MQLMMPKGTGQEDSGISGGNRDSRDRAGRSAGDRGRRTAASARKAGEVQGEGHGFLEFLVAPLEEDVTHSDGEDGGEDGHDDDDGGEYRNGDDTGQTGVSRERPNGNHHGEEDSGGEMSPDTKRRRTTRDLSSDLSD